MDKSLDDFVKKFGIEDWRPPVTELFLNYAQEKGIYQYFKGYTEVSRCMFGRKFYLRRILKKMEECGYHFLGEKKPGGNKREEDDEDEMDNDILELKLLVRFWKTDPGVCLEIILDGTPEQREAAFYSMSHLSYWGDWTWSTQKAQHLTINANDERIHSLYIHINKLNGKVYVGITKDIETRWYGDGVNYKGCPVFYKAIEKYGWDNFEHLILKDDLTRNEAELAEIELISKLKANNPGFGYNIEAGGAGSYHFLSAKDGKIRTVWDRTREKYGFPYANLMINNRQFLTWYMWAFYDTRVADYYEAITGHDWAFKPLRAEQKKFGG